LGRILSHAHNEWVDQVLKDNNGLPCINLEESGEDTAAILVQTGSEEAVTMFMQTVRKKINYEGYNKKQILEAKEA
jgi:hypothetical protein